MGSASEYLRKQMRERLAGLEEVIPWGVPQLDQVTGGIRKGDNIILLADSGVGKSSLAGWIGYNVAEHFKENDPGKEVRVVTLEMFGHEFVNRLVCSTASVPIPLNHVRDGWKGVELRRARLEQEAYERQLDYIDSLPLRFIDECKSNGQIHRGITEEIGGKRAGFFILDYIGLVPSVMLNKLKENEELARVSWGLTSICRKSCPGLTLAQIRKEVMRRGIDSRRPEKEDIYGPYQQINNSSLVLSLYRKDVYVELDSARKNDPRPAELAIKKNRHGSVGDAIKLAFLPPYAKWVAL